MAEEMRSHLAEQTQRNLSAGMSPGDARAAAHRQFGGVAQIQERVRDGQKLRWLEDLVRDLGLAVRAMRKAPGFALIAILMFALGIGAITTVFSWIERVLLDPLPGAAETGRIVALETQTASGELIDTSYADFQDYRARATTLSHVFVFKERPLNLGHGTEAERAFAQLVSANFFDALGVQPRLGRFFAPSDRADEANAEAVVVISEALWRRRFHADPGIIGRTLKLNQQDLTIIGVAPASFLGSLNGLAFDVWAPVRLQGRLTGTSETFFENRKWRALHVLARLAPTATISSARTELAGIAQQLAAEHPASNRDVGLAVLPVTQSPNGAHGLLARPLLLLLGVAALLLLLVCANLSNLILVRASARHREMCVRQALGANRLRLVRQQLAETLLLAVAGSTAGLALTFGMSDLLGHFIPDATLPIALSSHLSGRVLALAVALSAGAALLAGLTPAWWAVRTDLVSATRASGRSTALTPRTEIFRGGLVVTQVAIAVVTLTCAALAGKSFRAAKQAHPGFDSRGVLLASLKLDTSGYDRVRGDHFLEDLRQRLAATPGVEAVALAENVPLGLSRGSWEEVAVPGYTPAPGENLRVYRNLVSPEYFPLMRIPLLRGREFTAEDRTGAQEVAIVSRTFAHRYLGGVDCIGRTFSIRNDSHQLAVVGVVEDTKIHRLTEPASSFFYVPLRQFFLADTGVAVHLRTNGDPLALMPALRQEVRRADPSVAIFEALTLEDFTSAAHFAESTAASLLAAIAPLALTVTALGLYGMLAFSVAQRTKEIGVRLALGAHPLTIARLVQRRGAMLLALGLALGVLGAVAVSHAVAAALYGLHEFDAALLAGVVVLVFAAGLPACWFPARRAAHVDPIVALRAE